MDVAILLVLRIGSALPGIQRRRSPPLNILAGSSERACDSSNGGVDRSISISCRVSERLDYPSIHSFHPSFCLAVARQIISIRSDVACCRPSCIGDVTVGSSQLSPLPTSQQATAKACRQRSKQASTEGGCQAGKHGAARSKRKAEPVTREIPTVKVRPSERL